MIWERKCHDALLQEIPRSPGIIKSLSFWHEEKNHRDARCSGRMCASHFTPERESAWLEKGVLEKKNIVLMIVWPPAQIFFKKNSEGCACKKYWDSQQHLIRVGF